MKKVSELIGAELDYWVARSGKIWESAHEMFPTMTLDPTFNGVRLITYGDGRQKCILVPSNPMRQDPQAFSPSTNWAHGGPIIDQERIDLHGAVGASHWMARSWDAERIGQYDCLGPTPLISAMRAFVASKFGDEVPEEIPA